MDEIILLPKPQKTIWNEGFFEGKDSSPRCILDKTLPRESYKLHIDSKIISIYHSDAAGAFYAGQTLSQIRAQSKNALPCCVIEDAPALEIRGFMLDISRGKVPKLETLFHIADIMSMLKMNQFQLYIEGFSFKYPSFPQYCKENSSLTPDEIRALDRYCKDRYIDLVPCMNCLGHMAPWLEKSEFSDLAECPGGFQVMDSFLPSTTLDPKDPRSLELATTMTREILNCHTAELINMGLDEPFELGTGKNLENSTESIYGDYLQKIYDFVTESGKRMMMWGDVLANHPALYERMPKDIIVMEWGYEAEYPFTRRTKSISENGLDFCTCPGTSAWCSFTSMTENMLQNIKAAASAAHTNGGKGMILTDWGDGGHLQYLPSSFAPLTLAAALSWNPEEPTEKYITAFLDRTILKNCKGAADWLLSIGRYPQFESMRIPCRTLANIAFTLELPTNAALNGQLGLFETVMGFLLSPEVFAAYENGFEKPPEPDFDGLEKFLDAMETELTQIKPTDEEGKLIFGELHDTLNMVRMGMNILRLTLLENSLKNDERDTVLSKIRNIANSSRKEREKLWLSRNKRSGLDENFSKYFEKWQ